MTRPVDVTAACTFYVEETTFARRLQRTALEKAYHGLLGSGRSESVRESTERMFALCYSFMSKEQVLSKVKDLLIRTTQESSQCGLLPYQDLDGISREATFRVANTELSRAADSWYLRSIVMEPGAASSYLQGKKRPWDSLIDLSQYEGEWFDPGDVENYLRRRGVQIGGRSAFVDVEVDEETPLEAVVEWAPYTTNTSDIDHVRSSDVPSVSTITTPTKPASDAANLTTGVFGYIVDSDSDGTEDISSLPLSADDFDMMSSISTTFRFDDLLDVRQHGFDMPPRQTTIKRTKRMTLDVARLVDGEFSSPPPRSGFASG